MRSSVGPARLHRPSGARRGVAISGALLVVASLFSAWAVTATPAEAANADQCLDADGNATNCYDVAPVELPAGVTLGEYEIASVTRGTDGAVQALPQEFQTGSDVGACLPESAACTRLSSTFSLMTPDAAPTDVPGASGVPEPVNRESDSAVTQYDFNGDGVSETVVAARCRASNSEICLNVFNPPDATIQPWFAWSGWVPTGLYADDNGFGRIRLAAGVINERLTTITHAHYSIAPDQAGMLATFTTDGPTEYAVGQMVRLKPGSDLESHLCVTGSDGQELCVADLGSHYLPIDAVDQAQHTFSVRLGRLVDADPADPSTYVPPDWSDADCGGPACDAQAVAVTPGLAMAFAAPGSSLHLAAFGLNYNRQIPLRLIDDASVGKLGAGTRARAPFDVVTGDFDGLGVSEIALTWAAGTAEPACNNGLTGGQDCMALAFYDTNNGRQLVERSRQRLLRQAKPDFVDSAAGTFLDGNGTNTSGTDLAVGMALSELGHRVALFDVDANLHVHPAASWQPWTGGDVGATARSYIRVVGSDFDLDGTDEVAVAETRLGSAPSSATNVAPITVGIYRNNGSDQFSTAATWTSPAAVGAFGGFGSGQIDLVAGNLGRQAEPGSEAFPNTMNPDLVLGWTCAGASCGAAGGTGTAIEPMAVHVDSDGSMQIKLTPTQVPIVSAGDTPAAGTDSTRINEPSRIGLALGDFNADSETLGYPVTYVRVSEVKPLLILRAPPVQIDAFDDSLPHGINYYEVQDINGCFANASCDDSTHTMYSTSNTVDASVSGTVTNDWGVDASVKVGAGNSDVVVEAYVKATVNYAGQNSESDTAGKSFAYSTSHTVFAGHGDQAYAATQSTRIQEYPVFAGVSPTAVGGEPARTVVSINPAHTEFGWINLDDPDYGFSFSSPVSGNLLSYPSTGDQMPVGSADVDTVTRLSGQQIEVAAANSLGMACDLDKWQNLSTQYLTDYPCSGGGAPLTLTGAGSAFNGEYTLTTMSASNKATLTRASGTVPSASPLTCEPACRLTRDPGQLATGFDTVDNASAAGGTLTMTNQSGFEGSASWLVGGSVEGYFRLGGAIDELGIKVPVGLVEESLAGHYARTEASTMAVAATVGTTFEWAVGKIPTAGVSYRVRPWLAEDPVTHAMTLAWTATCASCNGAYWNYYKSAPDPALALPALMDPYKSPAGIPNIQGVDVLRSPGLMSWTCDPDGTCRPPASVPAGQPMRLTANVHNYSLKAYQSSSPLKVRFFAGDPARGGYQIAQVNAPNADRSSAAVQAECGSARFCIPAQGAVLATAEWTPPAALGGAGTPLNPFPVYAVIDPGNHVAEVHDWTRPVNLKACYQTYPYLPPSPADQYTTPESDCPTTNNEGYYLQQFSGKAGPRNDLFVKPSDIRVAPDGKSVKVDVHATKASAKSMLRLWVCRPAGDCSPATSDSWTAQATVTGIPAGGARRVTFGTHLGSGSWRIVAQVVPVSDFEAPGDPGYLPKMNQGKLANNIASVQANL